MPRPKKLQTRGVYAGKRAIYFNPARTPERWVEIEELAIDVDWLIGELRRLEERTGVPCLVAGELVKLWAQITYLMQRPSHKSDRAIIQKIADEACYSYIKAQQLVFSDVESESFLTETKAGREKDYYVPPEWRQSLDFRFTSGGEDLHKKTRSELLGVIKGLLLENRKLKSVNQSSAGVPAGDNKSISEE